MAAALVTWIGDRLTCVFVDHGLLRQGEVEQVEREFVAATGARLVVVDARKRFLDALAGVTDPEQKRKIIGREFIRVFETAANEVVDEVGGDLRFLVQGTLYRLWIRRRNGTANIKSHHNVDGLPEVLEFELVEPLRDLFRIRAGHRPGTGPARGDGLAPSLPGARLAIRIVGEVTEDTGRRCDWPTPSRARNSPPRGSTIRCRSSRSCCSPASAVFGCRGTAYVQPPGGPAPGEQRGRHDRQLVPTSARSHRHHLHPHHQRGGRGEPRGRRRDEQASRHYRVGVGGRPARPRRIVAGARL